MKNPGWQRFATSYGVYKVKRVGSTWWVLTPDGSKFPYPSRSAALGHFSGYKKRNSGMTKTERKAKAKRTATTRRKAGAVRDFLKKVMPKQKLAGARVKKNPGGSITITPIKAAKGRR